MPTAVVAIVGRPNVGKSSLFNRVVGKRMAVIDETPGVTRDRHYATTEWAGYQFRLVDTGGVVPRTTDQMELNIHDQVALALDEADRVAFVVDATTGLTDVDREVAQSLRKQNTPCVLFVNKVDSEHQEAMWHEFFSLGLGEPYAVSAMSGRGMGDALDALTQGLPKDTDDGFGDEEIGIALIGRPNVGKSSTANRLLGRDAMIVHGEPGTTRDAVDTPLERGDQRYVLIDTAGMRRKVQVWKSGDTVEYYSVIRTLRALERCQVAAVLMDALEPLTRQDIELIDNVMEAGKAMVLVINKWDLVPRDTDTMGEWVKALHDQLPMTANYPLVFSSAVTGLRTTNLLDEAKKAFDQWTRRVDTRTLNDFLKDLMKRSPPKGGRSGPLRLTFITQASVEPPTFVIFVNRPDRLAEAYRRFLERKIRETFGFSGAPIRFVFRRNRDGRDQDDAAMEESGSGTAA